MLHSQLELLKLQQLKLDFSEPSRLFMTEMAHLFLEDHPKQDLAAYSSVIVESLFKFGLLSLAEQLARKRRNEELPSTAFDQLAISYKNLANYDLDNITIPAHVPLHLPESGRQRLRALSFLYTTPAFQQNGYTVRTASILTNTALEVLPIARIGYPWTARLLRDNKKSLTATVNGISYHHRRGELAHQNDVIGNLALAKLEIKRIIAELRPDVVHAASNFTVGLPALLAARECRLPFVYEMRGIWELTAGVGIDGWESSERFQLERKMETFLARHADRGITLTETQKTEVVERGIDAERIHVVPNFFEGKHESEAPTSLIDELKAQIAGRRVVGYIGSIVNYEGLQDLVAAMSRPCPEFENLVLLIIGAGPYFDELKILANASSLGDRVIFTGRVPRGDAQAAYDLVDLCVLPRLDHPVAQLVSPLKLVEILAQGKVLLVSNVQAMVERVQETGFGEVFRSGDIDDLQRKMIGILTDIDAYKQHYATAPAHILENHTWKQGAKLWDRVLEQAVEDWRTLQKTEIVPPLAADATRTLLPPLTTRERAGKRLMVRIGRATLFGTKIEKVLLTTPDLRGAPEALLFDTKTHCGSAMSVEPDPKTAALQWRVGAQGDGERQLYLYAPADGFDPNQVKRWSLTTSTGKPIPITFEANRILALTLDQKAGREESLICASDYPEGVRFAMSIIPLQGAETLPLFDKRPFSAVVGARYQYVRIEPGEMSVAVNSGVKGPVLIELTAWQDGYRGQQTQIRSLEFEYAVEKPQSYYIDLPHDRHNVLVVARLNENLIDGSVIWLKTLVNSLAANPKTNVFVLTNSILIPNSINVSLFRKPNVTKIDVHLPSDGLERAMAVEAESLDRISGGFDTIIVRGTGVAREISNRALRARMIFYAVGLIRPDNVEDGICRDDAALHLMEGQAGLIFQSTATLDVFRKSRPRYNGKCYIVPPSVDAGELDEARRSPPAEGHRYIVYAGKAIREYGVLELLDAVVKLRRSAANRDIRLVLLGSKFDGNDPAFQSEFHRKVEALGEGIMWIPSASPVEVLSWVNRAAVVWGWRHGEFENAHFEVSTKMTEAICLNAPIVLYPSKSNAELLGADYVGFAETSKQAGAVIAKLLKDPAEARDRLATFGDRFHSANSYVPLVRDLKVPERRRGVLIASHDFRFIEDIEANLLRDGHRVHRQIWKNHFDVIERGELAALEDIDVIHCEWCLGNAVYWSNNLPPGKTLTIRLHLQEIFTEHPKKVDFSKVKKIIFISAHIMRQAIEAFNIPPEICEVVPISVSLEPRPYSKAEMLARRNVLGMVGITPWRKRPDLALELFQRLKERYHDLKLVIKGNMPSDYAWMKNRPDELVNYQTFFRNASAEPDVTFLPYDDDMQGFYEKAGWVMSVSDFEGCHTAVAEGGMLGSLPLMLNWGGADEVYPAHYVQKDMEGLEDAFDSWYGRFAQESAKIRDTFAGEFVIEKVYARWAEIMGVNDKDTNQPPIVEARVTVG